MDRDIEAIISEAKAIATPPHRLTELVANCSEEIKKTVANNPNTPLETLYQLGESYPQEFLDNPLLEVLYLENPNFVADIPINTLRALIQQPKVPLFILNFAANHNNQEIAEIAEIAKMHVAISGEMTEGWHQAAEKFIINLGSRYRFTIKSDYELLSNFAEFIPDFMGQNHCIKIDIAKNCKTSITRLNNLAKDKNDKIRSCIASNNKIPITLLKRLAQDSSYSVRLNLIDNRQITPNILKQLARDPDVEVRCYIAIHSNTPREILEQLASDRCYDVRQNIARNSNTPTHILERLTQDEDWRIRRYATQNLDKYTHTLNQFSLSDIQFTNLPLEKLEEYSQHKDRVIRQYLASNINLPLHLIKKLATDRNKSVRKNIAENPQTPINILENLTKDSSLQVRKSVAKNINTPLVILKQLAKDPILKVRRAVANNPNCTEDILITIFKNIADFKRPSLSRVALFLSNYAESSILVENCDSIYWLERYAIAQNPKTPIDRIKLLATDNNRIVRATAKESFIKRDR